MLREVLMFPEILSSRKVCSMHPFAQLFYRNLMHACDGAGVFEHDPELLLAYLYPTSLDRVNKDAVRRWLNECHSAGLIAFYTDDKGRALGRFVDWKQKDTNRKRRFQPENTHSDDLPKLFTADPPPRPPPKTIEPNRREGEGRREPRREAPPAPTPMKISEEDWQARLAERFPGIDIPAELERARRKWGKVERVRFEKYWLTNCGETVAFASASGPAGSTAAAGPLEPEAWRLYLKDRYEGESWAETAASRAWADNPLPWREKIAREVNDREPARR